MQGTTTACAACGKTISSKIGRCPFCNERTQVAGPEVRVEKRELVCPTCERPVSAATRYCRACERALPSAPEPRRCEACRKPYNQSLEACPWCGAGHDGSVPRGYRETREPRAIEGAGSPFAGAAPKPKSPLCPVCAEAPPGPGSLKVMVWNEDSGFFDQLRGRKRYRGIRVDAPAPCDGCRGWLFRRRIFATLLSLSPILPISAVLASSTWVAAGVICVFLYFGFVVLRWTSYGLADGLLYGGRLHTNLAAQLPPGDKIHFPVHWAHALLRVLLAFFFTGVLGLVALALGLSPS